MDRPKNCLILADGTVLENSSAGFADRSLWCWISGMSLADCFPIFIDPEKTKEISAIYTKTGIRYRGFKDMQIIRKGTDVFGNDTVDVRLTWIDGEEHSIEEFEIDDNEITE